MFFLTLGSIDLFRSQKYLSTVQVWSFGKGGLEFHDVQLSDVIIVYDIAVQCNDAMGENIKLPLDH